MQMSVNATMVGTNAGAGERVQHDVPYWRHKFAIDAISEHAVHMERPTQSQRVLTLAGRKGLLRASDLDAIGVPRTALTRLVATGQLDRVGRGLYRHPASSISEHEALAVVATRIPVAVICLLSALEFHGLTTQLPRRVWIAMPHGRHTPRMAYPPLEMVQVTGAAFEAGVEVHRHDGADIRVYSAAKTVVDCFKYRSRVGLDVAIEALKDGLSSRKVSVDQLWTFAVTCRVTNVMRPYLDAVA